MISARSLAGSLVVLSLIFSAAGAQAQWSPDGVFPAGDPAIDAVSDGAGGAIFDYGYSIVRRVTASGTGWADQTGSNAGTPGGIATDGSGGVFATGESSFHIYAQRVSADGVALWPARVRLCTNAGLESNPVIASDGAGGAIVIWRDQRSGIAPDLYAQRVDGAGIVQWGADGVPVCVSSGDEDELSVTTDGAGGVIVVWRDARPGASGGYDVYAQRLDAAGNRLWGIDGTPVNTFAKIDRPTVIFDGSGGAFVSWWDFRSGVRDVYMQRLEASGTALWPPDGVAVATGPYDELLEAKVLDGSGGVIVAWEDHRNGNNLDIYAQRLDASGSVLWAPNGIPVCAAAGKQIRPNIASDGSGGAVVWWPDNRSGTYDVYAQRTDGSGARQWDSDGVLIGQGAPGTSAVAGVGDGVGGAVIMTQRAYGVLPDGTPAWVSNYRVAIGGVSDVPSDQGGRVRLTFDAPLADYGLVSPLITGYNVWHRVRPWAGAAAPDRRIVTIGTDSTWPAPLPPGTWESLGFTAALGLTSYTISVPTRDDSTAAGIPTEVYLVTTHTTEPQTYTVSASDSGYSVDNLPPSAPQGLAGTLDAPSSLGLSWSPNGERDWDRYAVYRGSSESFTPSEANRIGSPTSPAWTDDAYDPSSPYYKVSALDVHGNESSFSTIGPGGIAGLPDEVMPRVSYLAAPAPNPSIHDVNIQFGLAVGGKVALSIVDVNGRHVRTLVDAKQRPGVLRMRWDGADAAGRAVAPGLYWLRLVAPDRVESRRIVRAG